MNRRINPIGIPSALHKRRKTTAEIQPVKAWPHPTVKNPKPANPPLRPAQMQRNKWTKLGANLLFFGFEYKNIN